MAISVGDAELAFTKSVANGAIPVSPPVKLVDATSGQTQVISEIKMFGDVIILWISGDFTGPGLPNYEAVVSPDVNFGYIIFFLMSSIT